MFGVLLKDIVGHTEEHLLTRMTVDRKLSFLDV